MCFSNLKTKITHLCDKSIKKNQRPAGSGAPSTQPLRAEPELQLRFLRGDLVDCLKIAIFVAARSGSVQGALLPASLPAGCNLDSENEMASNGPNEYVVKMPRIHPDFYLRAEWHDYASRCFYMITVNKSADAPVLSAVKGEITPQGAVARTELTPTGVIVENALKRIKEHYPFVEIGRIAVMPDHVHFMVFVKLAGKIQLGEVVRIFKKESSVYYKELFPESPIAKRGGSLFVDGFNDRIVYKQGQLDRFKRYVLDNPRRYYLRVSHPRFFNCCRNISLNGEVYSVYGNFMLLSHPIREFVKVSRRFTAEELQRRMAAWNETIRGAGVLISPFISPKEKEVMRAGIERGASIIRIVENGFPERYKPEGDWFDLCAEGRLLIIAPVNFNSRRERIKREQCVAMNELAERIANEEVSDLKCKNWRT